jgi:hypothetical protein
MELLHALDCEVEKPIGNVRVFARYDGLKRGLEILDVRDDAIKVETMTTLNEWKTEAYRKTEAFREGLTAALCRPDKSVAFSRREPDREHLPFCIHPKHLHK